MRTMREKYENDPAYSRCVDVMTMLITDNQFTPSEMREMAVMACVKAECMNGPSPVVVAMESLLDSATTPDPFGKSTGRFA